MALCSPRSLRRMLRDAACRDDPTDLLRRYPHRWTGRGTRELGKLLFVQRLLFKQPARAALEHVAPFAQDVERARHGRLDDGADLHVDRSGRLLGVVLLTQRGWKIGSGHESVRIAIIGDAT